MSDLPPTEPVGTPDPSAPLPPPVASPTNTTGLASNVAAMLACLFSIVGGVVFIVLEKKDKFVRFWAMQSIFLGGLAIAVSILTQIAFLILGFIPFLGKLLIIVLGFANMVFGIGICVVYILCAVKAYSKQEWEIPWLGKLARQQLARMDEAPAAAV